MADEKNRRSAVAQPPDQLFDALRLGHAERGRRLVHQYKPLRPVHCPGDRDCLALAAREIADRLARAVDAHIEAVEEPLRLG
jgi:hypothetical protein